MIEMEFCNCEHIRHFPNGEPYELPEWEGIARNGHPYMRAYAGETNSIVGRICDACAITCIGKSPEIPFDRESWARNHGWTVAEMESWEQTYGLDAETMAIQRLHEREEWRTLSPNERAPESHMH